MKKANPRDKASMKRRTDTLVWVVMGILILSISGIFTSLLDRSAGTVGTTVATTVPTAVQTGLATPTPVPTLTPSPTPTTLAMPTSTPTPSMTPTPTPKPSPTPTPKPTPTPTLKPTPKPSPTPKPTPTKLATPTQVVIADGFSYEPLSKALIDRITGVSYPADPSKSQVAYSDLRYIRLRHYTFEGKIVDGELIVNTRLAKEVTTIFHELYKAKYPLASVRLVDDYDADDRKSMTANNTSAFNYRFVSGTTRLSQHAYGSAIDINPVQNPYVYGDYVSPENGRPYADRTKDFVGKIDHDDLCYKLFVKYGWTWGGDWKYEKDYQHFQKKLN